MLILVLFLCLVVSIYVAVRRRDVLSLYLLGLSLTISMMLAGVVMYIAKMGGLAATEKTFLFLWPEFQRWLQMRPIPMNILGYIVAIGRTMFPYLLLQVGLEVGMIPQVRRRLKLLKRVSIIIPLLFLVYYYPKVFRFLVRGRFWLLTAMLPVSMAWIVVYLVLAFFLLIQEYRAITIRLFKRHCGYILLSTIGITALYLLYATKDPAQIYNMFMGEYIRMGFTSYISPSLSVVGWLILGVCTVFFVGLGSYGMVCYAQLDYTENREEVSLQRKFGTAGTVVSVFVHGIKNQLLSSQVLHKKLSRLLDAAEPDMEQIRTCAGALRDLNEGMLGRMDELYRTVKNNTLSLTSVAAAKVAASSIQRFHAKYPAVEIQMALETRRLVLADIGSLSEAVYNLLCNGCEAAVQAGREPALELIVRGERLWTIFEIRDNGGGIPPELQTKIYEPFFTSKNTNYNWGMGLYYVRRIIKSHFGRISLESREGEGSSFFVMLPLFDEEQRG